MGTTAETGRMGERAAAEFLRRAGYEICALNWRSGRYELDIVARKGISCTSWRSRPDVRRTHAARSGRNAAEIPGADTGRTALHGLHRARSAKRSST
ncbi:MAG: YraN family protein [Alistipes finegoldii]